MRRRRKRLPRRVVLRLQVRPRAPPPAPPRAPPRHLAGSILRTAGIIRLLLETPTGFGIFSFDGAYLKKDYNDIWSYFADELWLRKAIWLKELLLFENKSTAINLENGDIHANLVEFLKKWCDSKEKLVVEREEYKRIIERNMEITCLYDDNVEEVLWGLKNNMGYLVLEEKTVLAKKVCLPMSKRFEMFLSRYGFDMKPEMVNNHIAQQAAILHRNDLAMEKHSVFFDLVRESIKNTPAMDTVGWSAIKLATAAVMMCYPEKIPEACDRSKIFSPRERSKIKEYASECQDVLLKSDPWVVYKNVLFLSEKRSIALARLTCLVEKTDAAFKSDEAFVMSEPLLIPEKIESNGESESSRTKFVPVGNELKQVDSIFVTTADQTSIAEGQHCLVSDAGTEMYAVQHTDDTERSKHIDDTEGTEMYAVQHTDDTERSKHIDDTEGTEMYAVQHTNDTEGSKLAENVGGKKATEAWCMGNFEERDHAQDTGADDVREQIMDNLGEKSMCAKKMDENIDADYVEDQYNNKSSRRNRWPWTLCICCYTVQ